MLNKETISRIILAIAIFGLILHFSSAEDTDGDLLDDLWEMRYFGNLTLTGFSDPDRDAISNLAEYRLGSIPISNDTDIDGWSDTSEYLYGTNLTDAKIFPTQSLVNITIINPKFGVSTAAPFDLKLTTSNQSDCKYSTSPTERYETIDAADQKFSTADGLTHQILDFPLSTSFETAIYVICKTKSGYANDDFPKEFLISIDSSEPRILSSYSDPAYVIEKLEVTLNAETDDKCICKFPPAGTNLSDLKSLFKDAKIDDFKTKNSVTLTKTTKPKIDDNQGYTFIVACMNKAEAPAINQITFKVNLSVQNLILEKSPSGYLKTMKSDLKVVTNKDSTCKYGEGYLYTFPQISKKSHYIARDNLTEGTYNIPFMCIFTDASVKEDTISFIIDTTYPVISNISALDETCMDNYLFSEYYSLDKDLQNYTVKLLDYKNTVIYSASTALQRTEVANLSLTRGQKYYWEVYVTDLAGNNGSAKRSTGTAILAADDEKCLANKPPYIDIDKKMTPLGAKIGLLCKDDDSAGSCQSTYYSIIDSQTNASCSVCGSCGYSRYLSTTNILIKNESTICYNITDNRKKSVEDSFVVRISPCSGSASCCARKQGEVCTKTNCTLITSLECSVDNLDSDSDGILDKDEVRCILNPDDPKDALLDYDNDTLSNKEECQKGTDNRKKDSDGDGYDDNVEIAGNTEPLNPSDFPIDENKDTDSDGITDIKEDECGLDKNNANDANKDEDGDLLSNYRECLRYGTDLNKKDTDEDGYDDNIEIDKSTDPKDKSSFPESHILQILLFAFGIIGTSLGAFLLLKDGLPSMPGFSAGTAGSGKSSFPGAKKPLIDFGKAKKEMSDTQPSYTGNPGMGPGNVQANPQADEKLDLEIKKKREELRVKKMTNVFDEFANEVPKLAEEKNEQAASVVERVSKQRSPEEYLKEKVFNRLDDISKDDAFEELEKMKKRKKNE